MSAWGWFVSAFYALCLAILIILIVTLLIALVAWLANGGGSGKKKGCCKPSCNPLCPVYLRNPYPDDRVFPLARVDGSTSADNGCATGSFTIQRVSSSQLLYTVTTPPDTFITDIYALEVLCEDDFPLTSDHCGVDLTQFHHESYPCEETSNVQSFTSTLSQALTCAKGRIFISLLVVFSDSETCDPVQMMTITGQAAKPITLTGNCITPPCPPQSCCDPIVPSFVKLKLPKCTLVDSSSSSSSSSTATTTAATTTTIPANSTNANNDANTNPPTAAAAAAAPAAPIEPTPVV